MRRSTRWWGVALMLGGIVCLIAPAGCSRPSGSPEVADARPRPDAPAVASEDPEADDELARLSAEFKALHSFRADQAAMLMPHLEIGMTEAELKEILGEPTSGGGQGLVYILDYSMLLEIQFDETGGAEYIRGPGPDNEVIIHRAPWIPAHRFE